MKFSRSLLSLILLASLVALVTGCIDQNTRPVASFIADPTSGSSPLTVDFDASTSHDPDGTIVSYSWDFGDGVSGTGVTTSHTFTATTDKTYTVRLTVTDSGGKSATALTAISVAASGNGGALFFDDFNDGLRPEWDVTPGWAYGEGILIHRGSGSVWAYVGHGTAWSDYEVEVDLDPRNEDIGIVVRCKADLQSYVLVWGDHGKLRCRTYVDGEIVDDMLQTPGFFEGEQHMRVAAEGSTIRVYINDNLRLTATGVSLLSGMPGLYGWGYSGGASEGRFDNFRVTALP